MAVQHDLDSLNTRLQRSLRFNAADLAANARGELSPQQVENLSRGRGCYRAFGCWFAAIGLPGSLVMMAAAAVVYLFLQSASALILGGIGVLVFGGTLYVLLAAHSTQRPQALDVRLVEGAPRVRIHAASDSVYDGSVTIEGVTFRTTSYAARLFRNGSRFRVYYVQNGFIPMLLSVEALS